MLSPVFVVVSILIYLKMGSPVIFKQQRPGLKGQLFEMYKFRTMVQKNSDGAVGDEARITPLGAFLRSTSLDELPELINVVKGDMSLIGPRPLLVEYLNRYTAEQMRRHDALPGVTGLAQVKGRNNLSWKNKFRYDLFYVDHMGWKMDLYIFLLTLKVVLMKTGFRSHGEPRKFGDT